LDFVKALCLFGTTWQGVKHPVSEFILMSRDARRQVGESYLMLRSRLLSEPGTAGLADPIEPEECLLRDHPDLFLRSNTTNLPLSCALQRMLTSPPMRGCNHRR